MSQKDSNQETISNILGKKNSQAQYPDIRMRRLRSTGWMRDMIAEHRITPSDLILPLFVIEGENQSQPIESMPGVNRQSIDLAIKTVKQAYDLGIPAIALFPAIDSKLKNDKGTEATNPDNLICRTVQAIKKAVPDIGIITDVALDPYTTHGHDGLIDEQGYVLNDETIEILRKQALVQTQAGADIIAPSDMMDGRIAAIRSTLDESRFINTAIMAYSAKFASAFYGPFRDAVNSDGALKGDKKTYQMNPANRRVSIREVQLDINEGADMVMVKPGLPYLDIVRDIKTTFQMPTFAYHVSGEFAMLKAASENGWLDYDACLIETLLSFRRAGCDGILTYGAIDAAKILVKA
ncbi:MAG: porphobilinogen synthase [Alphaproteobacteria bacterium]|nr:porphobilinogen synthase [Alphaproteobacteria bacterium]